MTKMLGTTEKNVEKKMSTAIAKVSIIASCSPSAGKGGLQPKAVALSSAVVPMARQTNQGQNNLLSMLNGAR